MMTELLRIGCIFYEDLSADPRIESALFSDHFLTEDEFVARYTKIIQQRYATVMRLDLSHNEASFFASCIWHYLKTLDTVNGQIIKVSPCCLQKVFRKNIGL
ncbi:hypothetical protein GWK36_08355 [Caldichromatium japonicum]|uniref:Uncharacterized protein n=1 Tax=Caldichromatium japonicum TaxID=2699430 RepID=A0A6G7VDX6_9GAMM|nr:hypothetical protein [Caldichromatium japonicum]QIK37997.1 hypothetical protein GWK36_08355 [Caldichromatium japonicum]